MSTLNLTAEQRAMLAGSAGPAVATAMRVIVGVGEVGGAKELIPIGSAHIDSCLYHGRAGLDFAEQLVGHGAAVTVPTTLNVSSLDLLHPRLVHGDAETMVNGRRLMDAYVAMGGRPTWTCAPYQADSRPGFGEHVAWAESNAIVFANSVLGARTDRYGDFLDICAAITGLAPLSGLHLDENRLATMVFDVSALPPPMLHSEILAAVLGYLVGARCGTGVPAIVGLPHLDEDALKAFGAAAASSGGVGLFHAVGTTPEAPDLKSVLTDADAVEWVRLTRHDLAAARAELITATGDLIDAVSIGTPHCSLTELTRLAELVDGRRIHPDVDFYACTGRTVLAQATAAGISQVCEQAGVQFVTDTCTYITPVLRAGHRTVMTNSAKWAHYAPGNLDVEVVMASLSECVTTACNGKAVRHDPDWALN
nr:aconitase X catalytic domain-containing protein [Nakamurella sp. PAMC28650]